ncbi:MAG: antibiotic biosynthesis monooxygenase [Kosmotogaceae bacterium]|nr:antibiotic biosynthesis monooxygenase [Kosmotogaceae bacterium]
MLVTLVDIQVKGEFVKKFIEATRDNYKKSVREPGNLRFDFLQDEADPCHFFLYEAYESEEAAANHKNTDHYRLWKERVEEYMKNPRKGTKTRVIEPVELHNWK